jgi:peptidoglycan/xylan/chitin deacetylase (PgdA/CDA1 family)
MLIAVNFHYIRPSFPPGGHGIRGLTPGEFQQQLEMLGTLGEFVGAADIEAAIAGVRALPARAIAITLDDGLREQYEHAWPILQRMRIPATFYVNTAPLVRRTVLTVHKIHLLRDALAPPEFLSLLGRHAAPAGIDLRRPVDAARAHRQYEYDSPEVAQLKFLLNLTLSASERAHLIDRCFAEQFAGEEEAISARLYMDRAQVREIGRQAGLGLHGHEHLPIGVLSKRAAERELLACRRHLEELLGYRPFTLSYPYGERAACSARAGRIAARLGVRFAFTMERAANHDLEAPLHLARFDSNDVPGGKRPYWPAGVLFDRAPAASWCRTRRPPGGIGA